MDRNNNPRWDGRAILQIGDLLITPTTNARNCSSQNLCHILNCPFTQYGSDPNIICLTMRNTATDPTHIDKELISSTAKVAIKHTLSLTVVEPTDEESGYEAINYLNMAYPTLDRAVLYEPKLAREKLPCLPITEENGEIRRQKCYHNIIAEYNDIVEFLIVNFDADQHPLHMHGSFFHVLEQGFAQLNKTTGLAIDKTPNVVCDDDDINCECVNCTVNTLLVKDTTIIPSGGYNYLYS